MLQKKNIGATTNGGGAAIGVRRCYHRREEMLPQEGVDATVGDGVAASVVGALLTKVSRELTGAEVLPRNKGFATVE